ncbi:hypothetical protein HDV05_004155 [Chytridiales sp. JEL 0842]|nr:hypothetical protein HDV05_004155 [Chytridiales sp. JEL 0842]
MHLINISQVLSLLVAASAVSALPQPPNGKIPPGQAKKDNKPGNPSEVVVKSFTFSGSGCPRNTASYNFNADKTAFTLIFDQYVASIGNGAPTTDSRKDCQVMVDMRLPVGWQYSITTVDYRGFALLDQGVTATLSASYHFAGNGKPLRNARQYVGPMDTDYVLRDTFGAGDVEWSGCGKGNGAQGEKLKMKINTAIALSGNGVGLLTRDAMDQKVSQVYGLSWRQC